MSSRIKRYCPYLFIFLMVLAILSFQLLHPFFINGIDSFFHMSVTYDTYRQLKTENFSYFLSAFGFNHSLRIVNAVYGPLGNYFSGFLLLITGSWYRWEIVMYLLVFTIAGISMYQLCRYWRVTKFCSVLMSCLYMFSFPIMSFWLNSQYDGIGAIFMPWILEFGSRILTHHDFKSWQLTLLLFVMAELHVFSFFLGDLVLLICYLIALLREPRRLHLTVRIVKSVFLSVVLAFNVFGGILEVLSSNQPNLVPTYSFKNMFQNIWSCVRYVRHVPLSQNLFLLGFSATVMIVLTFGLYLVSARKLTPALNVIMIVFGLGFLLLSSRYFPWAALQTRFPILDTDLQFPKRFLPVSLTALDLTLGYIISRYWHQGTGLRVTSGILILLTGIFIFHSWQNLHWQTEFLNHENLSAKFYRGSGLASATGVNWIVHKDPQRLRSTLMNDHPGAYFDLVNKSTPDYLPTTQSIRTDAQYHHLNAYNVYFNQITRNQTRFHYQLIHHVMNISFNSDSSRLKLLPFVKYAHTSVILNGKVLKHPQRSAIGALQIHPNRGENLLKIQYHPSGGYKFGMLISILIWILFLGWRLYCLMNI